MTLTAIPKDRFSWNFSILEEGVPVGEIRLAWVRDAGELEVEGTNYELYRDNVTSGPFILESAGVVVARAVKPHSMIRSFKVEHGGKTYTLETNSPFRSRFVLRDGDRIIGSVLPFSQETSIDLPEQLPLAVRLFLVCLVMFLWRRQADAAIVSY